MNKLLITIIAALFAANVYAQASDCESKAVGKNGKPLSGAAKTSFMKKCEADTATKSCEEKAVDKNGKPLAGAAKASSVKKCVKDTTGGSK